MNGSAVDKVQFKYGRDRSLRERRRRHRSTYGSEKRWGRQEEQEEKQ